MKKRLLSILLLFAMALTLLPVAAHAENFTFRCQVCGNWVSAPGTYKYLDGTHCTLVTECPECGDVSATGFWEHRGSGTATCTTGITCDLCGGEFGALGHDWSWTSNGDGTHTRTCQREGCGMTETASCTGGTATCIEKAVCQDCGAEYGEKAPDHHTGDPATCVAPAVCKDCGKEFEAINPDNHTGGTATCTAKAICQRCGEEYGDIAPNNHSGGTATCVAKAICELCGKEYGEIDPDNHDYRPTDVTDPTCTEPGSATLVCKYCNDTYTKTLPAKGHLFYGSGWKEVSTAEGSGIELECAVCSAKETVPLHVLEYKAGETYTDTGWTNIDLLSKLLTWSDKYTFENVGEKGFAVKTTAGKLLLTVTQTQGDGDTDVFTILVDEGVTSEDGDTVVLWEESYEPEYGIKCVFLAHAHKAVDRSQWEADETRHWQLCACGAKLNIAAHSGTATCTEAAVCIVCGHQYLADHAFTAEVADARYLRSAATCTERAEYYKSCTGCGLSSKDTAEEATFFSGDAPSHDWGDWTQDSGGKTHTRVCKRNAEHTETGNCTGGTATCVAKALCETCKAEYGEKDPDNHAAGCAPQWTITETEHSQKYSRCGKVTVAKAPHTFGPWTTTQEPAPEQTGEKEHTCEVCEYKQTEIIPATGYAYYTIRATAYTGGSISPSGDVSVREGLDRTFTITPNRGYSVSNIKIDGVNVGTARSYTFENVSGNHTIEVSFQKTTGSPQTGDGINLPLLCVLLTASALGLAGIALFRRKRTK